MKLVEFTRDVLPHRIGERRVLPDDVAARLEASGEIAANPPDHGKKPFPTQQSQPDSASPKAAKHNRRQTYLTK
ncbi:MAG: hypothetical protein WDN46_08165 [Methylocella sp.]